VQTTIGGLADSKKKSITSKNVDRYGRGLLNSAEVIMEVKSRRVIHPNKVDAETSTLLLMKDLDILSSMRANTIHTIAALEKAIEEKVKSSNDVMRATFHKNQSQLSPLTSPKA
jgi:D-alanine-D-alanine ligase-like ATP-grasp enzyme